MVKEKAAKKYDKILVVDISGTKKGLAEQIAKELGGEVGNLPSDEKKPSADILIILGSDYIK